MAFGHNKPVILIAKQGTPISLPLSGIAAVIIEYENIEDIQGGLEAFITQTNKTSQR